jgi:DNA (cytosine-5)-methyltransferase 1
MWVEMARIIREVAPRYVFVENSPMLTSRGLGRVLGDLAAMGFNARWGVLGACDVGAPHKRERIWIVANSMCKRNRRETGEANGKNEEVWANWLRSSHEAVNQGSDVANPASERQQGPGQYWFRCDPAEKREGQTDWTFAERVGHIWGVKSSVGRVANGVAARVDRLKAIGNGQVPSVAALAWRILSED